MANVLTLEDKNTYKRIRFLRALTTLLAVLNIGIVLGMSALIPAYLQARNIESDVDMRIHNNEIATDGDVRQALNTQSLLARRQIEALRYTVDAQDTSVVRSVVGMIEQERASMTLTHYAFSTKNNTPILSISGVAQDRDALARLGKLLQAHEDTRSARIPESLFANKSGIEFSIPIPLSNQ